jgi:LacI family transcriptional regulator, gluconate utilization system Gnt-I transcriptional repressor
MSQDLSSQFPHTLAAPSRRAATISDVAKAAGVSSMTVSKALRGIGRISPPTRARVLRIAEEMGYVPNGLAGALSSQSSTLVGVLIPSLSDQVHAGVLAGINAVLHPQGYTSLIGETFFDPQNEARVVRMMLSMKPAGLILTGGLARTEATARLLAQSGVRTVQLWDGDRPDLDATVGVSHLEAGRTAARTFLAAGLTRACYIGAELQRDLCAGRRMDGFVGAMTAAGATCHKVIDPGLPRTADSGYTLTRRLLDTAPLPEAIHYLNDAMAVGGLRCLLDAGLDVPEAVSVIGFNGTALQHAVRTRLTTIEVPLRDLGERAGHAMLDHDGASGRPLVELVGFRLVEGTTVKPRVVA